MRSSFQKRPIAYRVSLGVDSTPNSLSKAHSFAFETAKAYALGHRKSRVVV
jgi:hypothetical protein